jgi:thioesterase domain-containing protein/acyl carrier protein
VIAASREVDMPVTSLEDVPAAERESRLTQALRDEASVSFSLVRGPLTRARLFRLAPAEHVLILTTHHILTDGWSQNVMQRDLWTFYEAFLEGREPSLPDLSVQYGDFIHWQQDWLASDRAQQELDFWKQKLTPSPPVLRFPREKPSRTPSASAPMETLLLPEELVRSLKSICQSQSVTLFVALLAAYAALLRRYTGETDICIGSPVANRKLETEPLIGPFAGPVTLRLDLSGNPSFLELLGRVRDVTLDALSHTDVPFETLLENLQVRSVRGRNPLSQCYFFYQNAFLQPRSLPGLTVTPLPDFGLGTHYELQLGMLERREGVRAQLEFNPHLFEPAAARSILEDLRITLDFLQADSARRIDDLPITVEAPPQPSLAADSAPAAFEPPQGETELHLAAIWENLLRVQLISRRANYFDLGGNSLIALRMFDSIEKVLKIKLPLSSLFEAQTIAALAGILQKDNWKPSWHSLVPLRAAGSKPPLLLMHGHGGTVFEFHSLANRLEPDQPVYALQARGLDGSFVKGQSVEEMAAAYVSEVRGLQKAGPYFLGGFCFGGVVALEAAQQLTAAGEEVALLIIIQTIHPAYQRFAPGISPFRRWLYRSAKRFDLERDNLSNRGAIYILQRARRIWDLTQARFELAFDRFVRNGHAPRANLSMPYILESIARENDKAFLRYSPRKYAGDVVLFRAGKQMGGLIPTQDLGWDEIFTGKFEVCDIPGHQQNMLSKPHVARLADELNARLRAAQQRSGCREGLISSPSSNGARIPSAR